MTRSLIVTIGALGIAATTFAQTPPPAPTQAPRPMTPPAASADMHTQNTTVTGCLKAGVDANSFELKRDKKDQPASAASDAGGSAKGSKGLKLVASAGVDLASHIGHQVELTGSWAAPGASADAHVPAASASASATAAAAAAKTFTVSNVKMVSATCTAGTN